MYHVAYSMKIMLLLFLFLAVLLLHLLFVKKNHLFNQIIALYASIAAILFLPTVSSTAAGWIARVPYGRAGAFVILFILLSILFRFSNIQWFSSAVTPMSFFTSLAYRAAIVGLLFAGVLYFLPENIRSSITGPGPSIFLTPIALLFWLLFPLFLAFAYRFKTKTGWLA